VSGELDDAVVVESRPGMFRGALVGPAPLRLKTLPLKSDEPGESDSKTGVSRSTADEDRRNKLDIVRFSLEVEPRFDRRDSDGGGCCSWSDAPLRLGVVAESVEDSPVLVRVLVRVLRRGVWAGVVFSEGVCGYSGALKGAGVGAAGVVL
jgi:hypothetical protein